VNVYYQRAVGDLVWSSDLHGKKEKTQKQRSTFEHLPRRAVICRNDYVPIRTAKFLTCFREKLLRRMLAGQLILCNMVLFHCTTRNERFPTWHPNADKEQTTFEA
jgi:hypothetical protein